MVDLFAGREQVEARWYLSKWLYVPVISHEQIGDFGGIPYIVPTKVFLPFNNMEITAREGGIVGVSFSLFGAREVPPDQDPPRVFVREDEEEKAARLT